MSKEHYELQQFYNKIRELQLYDAEDWKALCMRHGKLAHDIKDTIMILTRSSKAEQASHKSHGEGPSPSGSTN